MATRIPKAEELQHEEEKILKEEKKIENETRELLEVNNEVKKLVKKDIEYDKKEEALEEKESTTIQKYAINNLKQHKIIFTFVIFFAVLLVWRGAWAILDSIPIFSYSLISFAVGIIILWLFKKFKEL